MMNLAEPPSLQPASATCSPRTGTQSLSRGIKLLRMVATRPQFGWRLSDLAVACSQDRATVHRMLTCLVEERLIEQRQSDRHYLPGPLMYELGLARTEDVGFQHRAEVIVRAFARRMAGVARLQLRSGDDYVCSVRAGQLTLTGDMVTVGTRRTLCSSAGGVAILQTLPPHEAARVLHNNLTHEIERHGTTRLQALQKMRDCSDRHGFGVNFGFVVPRSYAFAVPVRGAHGNAIAALCLVGTPEIYSEDRLEELHEKLLEAAAQLQAEAQKSNM